MTTRNFPRRSARRGYAMVVVLVFLALMLSMLAVSQRQLGSVLRMESSFVNADARGNRKQAMGNALDILWTGAPPSDPYVCSTIVQTTLGPKSYTITYERQGGNHYQVRVEPTATGDDPPPLPSSF